MTAMNSLKGKQSRWPILLGTIIVMLGLGTIYTWSLFNQPLSDQFGWKVSSIATTFSITSFALAVSTLFSSKIQEKLGIRGLLILAGIGMGIGLIVSSFASELWLLYIFAGGIMGAANGIAYMTTLSNAIQWFPEKRGLVSGISVGAYGTSSLVFKYVFSFFLIHVGVSETFLYWGIISSILIIGGSFLIKQARVSVKQESKSGTDERNYTPKQMLHTKQSYLLFFIFFTACMSGLYLIGSVANIGVSLAKLDTSTAANAVALVAIFNTTGRIVLGTLSDHVERIKVISGTLLVMGIAALILSHLHLNMILFFVSVSSVAFCFGGNITIFPAIVSEFFGLQHQNTNYGIVYQGFGIGGISASFVSGLIGGFLPTFNLIAVLCIVSSVIAFLLHKPKDKHVSFFKKEKLQEQHVY